MYYLSKLQPLWRIIQELQIYEMFHTASFIYYLKMFKPVMQFNTNNVTNFSLLNENVRFFA